MPPRTRAQDETKSSDMTDSGRAEGGEAKVAGAGAQIGAKPGQTAVTSELRLPVPEILTRGNTGKRLLWLGGLGAMATVGLLEWPVAVAVGAGSLIAEQLAKSNRGEPADRPAEHRASESGR